MKINSKTDRSAAHHEAPTWPPPITTVCERKWNAHKAAASEMWVSAWLFITAFAFGAVLLLLVYRNEELIPGLIFPLISVVAAPFAILRYRQSYRILRYGLATIGYVVQDQSVLGTPLIGNDPSKHHRGLRITYAYHFDGKDYQGVTCEQWLGPYGKLNIVLKTHDSTGEALIVLFHPDKPTTARSVPRDIELSTSTLYAVSQALGIK